MCRRVVGEGGGGDTWGPLFKTILVITLELEKDLAHLTILTWFISQKIDLSMCSILIKKVLSKYSHTCIQNYLPQNLGMTFGKGTFLIGKSKTS